MEKRKYKKPFMATEEFDPNFCTTPCQKDTLLIFDESSFYKKLYHDKNGNGYCEDGELVADYDEIPTKIFIDLKENEWPEGFYLYGKFINYASGRSFYINTSFNESDKRKTVYAAKDKEGNYYYFSSRPTTRDTHS